MNQALSRASSGSGLQVPGEPADLLLFVAVAVLLPGFADHALGAHLAGAHVARLARGHGPAAHLVAHDVLDALGERTHVLLEEDRGGGDRVRHGWVDVNPRVFAPLNV